MKIKKFKEYNKLSKDYFTNGIEKVKNAKPAVNFDRKYGTKLSQEYNFPFGLTADEVWNLISYNNKFYDKNEKDSQKLIQFSNNLTKEHFPYTDLSKLNINQKMNLLFGMSSCFNSDDIIWFVINGINYSKNTKINNEIKKLSKQVIYDIEWVVSPNTLIKLKNFFKSK